MGMHILIYGNPVDGFCYIGPFKTADDAINAAETDDRLHDSEWWIAPLEAKQ